VMLEADRVMKCLAIGKDNVTGNPIASGISGYRSVAQRLLDKLLADPNSFNNFVISWHFAPSDVKLVRSADGKSFVFDRTAVQLLITSVTGSNTVRQVAQDYADWF